jgi:hypothetical protein
VGPTRGEVAVGMFTRVRVGDVGGIGTEGYEEGVVMLG